MIQFFLDSTQFIISGALVGLLVGMTGVGGGSLMTPLLTIIFGVAPTTAVGTDLAFAAITKGFGTAAHRLHGNVRWDIVRLLCIGSLTTAILSILALKYVGPVSKNFNHLISISIGISVLLTAGSLLFRAKILKWVQDNPDFFTKRIQFKNSDYFSWCCHRSVGNRFIHWCRRHWCNIDISPLPLSKTRTSSRHRYRLRSSSNCLSWLGSLVAW